MLNKRQLTAIKSLIAHAEDFLSEAYVEPGTDFASLYKCVMQQELIQEINQCLFFLNPVFFPAFLKMRLRSRFFDKQVEGLNIQINPTSIVNKLYWDLAKVVYSGNPIEVLFPGITSLLTASLRIDLPPGTTPLTLKNHIKNPVAFLSSEPLLSISFNELPFLIITDRLIFDIRNIKLFSLALHQQIYNTIKEQYPELLYPLYHHNSELISLELDLLTLENKAQTPKEALSRLRHGLTLGGTRVTGKEFAESSAQAAYLRFFDYFNKLPESLQQELNALVIGNQTLSEVLENFRSGGCVETAAESCSLCIGLYANHPILNASPLFAPSELNALHKKYKNHTLECKKDISLNRCLPPNLANAALKIFNPSTIGDFITLIHNFPPEWYSELFKHLNQDILKKNISELRHTIQHGLFSSQQLDELIQAATNQFGLYKGLKFAIATNIEDRVNRAIEKFPENDRLE
ncbi:MAG: hypothetical protein ACHP6H_02275, partial [Legionellales bacterium]